MFKQIIPRLKAYHWTFFLVWKASFSFWSWNRQIHSYFCGIEDNCLTNSDKTREWKLNFFRKISYKFNFISILSIFNGVGTILTAEETKWYVRFLFSENEKKWGFSNFDNEPYSWAWYQWRRNEGQDCYERVAVEGTLT